MNTRVIFTVMKLLKQQGKQDLKINRKGHEFNSHTGLNIFQASLSLLLK